MDIGLECTYCGHKWEKTFYNKHSIEAERCPRCKDASLKVKDLAKTKVDYYQDSPPFPPKKDDDGGWSNGGAWLSVNGLD
jgi:DNA-directed RNA polymerase subunit RPC12/RpoP